MKKQLEAMVLVLAVAIFMMVMAFLPANLNAGSLEPPPGEIGPTMRTLDEIYQAITPLPTGFALCEENPRFAVWDKNTSDNMSDDVVLDRATELMWARDTNLDGNKDWQGAIDYCDSLTLGYREDWRLPSLRDLVNLTEPYPSEHSPALPSGHPFVNVQSNVYWSSTTDAHYPEYAWLVDLSSGRVGRNDKSFDYYYVWCVRGGQ